MGRLFWKFFFSIWLAQVVGVLAISGGIWIKDRNHARMVESIETGPPAWFLLDASEATLRSGGMAALRELLERNRHEQVYALDGEGRDILGRDVDPAVVDQARQLHGQDAYARAIRTLTAPDGKTWLVYAARRQHGGPGPRHGEPPRNVLGGGPEGGPKEGPRGGPGEDPGGMPGYGGRPPPPPDGGPREPMPGPRIDTRFPAMPMIFAMLASLVSAGLLAWHFAKPIRNLRSAFDAAAAGKLDTRIGPAMGSRRDELADLGRDFDRMAAQLQALVEGQRRLLHDVSHELRSPLARMHAAIGLARQNTGKTEAMLERIERESARMDSLIGELLALSRLEAGVTGLLDDSVDISELAAELVEDARFEAHAAGKNVIFTNGAQAMVRGRAELLHSAIENVVRNAIRHTAASTSVVVSVEQPADEGKVHVAVRDYGPGVPEDELDMIFRPFVRSSTSASLPGHGLGLAIAQRVIQAHGGTISASNAEGGGLRVEILLPAAEPSIN